MASVNALLGKAVWARRYVHTSALQLCSPEFIQALDMAVALVGIAPDSYNVVRLDQGTNTIGLLDYANFFEDAFPTLTRSWKVALDTRTVVYRTYSDSLNPPVLHRKELLLAPTDSRRIPFERLTREAEAVGLFGDPLRIGYRVQWERFLAERGFRIVGHDLVPIGNVVDEFDADTPIAVDPTISRHLTALSRSALSAPVRLLHHLGLLDGTQSLFDYGCGKGDDVRGLTEMGVAAQGWDPHYAPENTIVEADVVNIGFVINVIEDPAERREALLRAFGLARKVLAVSVMIAAEGSVRGTPFADGVLTARNTFQRYFTQDELRQYVEGTLCEPAIPAAPGIAFIFKDKAAEQRFLVDRLRSPLRVRAPSGSQRAPRDAPRDARRIRPRATPRPSKCEAHRELLMALWRCALDLGREPAPDEFPQREEAEQAFGSVAKAFRFAQSNSDPAELSLARAQRENDLLVYFALQAFRRQPPYRHLEPRLRNDVKAFFGNYAAALTEGRNLLLESSQPTLLENAARDAMARGLGWLDGADYLHLDSVLLPRLPAVLRTYVGCASLLYGDIESVDLIKIHLHSGKVSLMIFDDFTGSPVPRMIRRVKVNLRTQDVAIFEYGEAFASPFLYLKSRFMNEESCCYAEQVAFDEALEALRLCDFSGFGPDAEEFSRRLHEAHWQVAGYKLKRLHYVPDLDSMCGQYLTYRQLIECGETRRQLALANLPTEPATYTALWDLAVNVLDPVIDYFGMIELTYGFCSHELARRIPAGIAPKLDQHAAHEREGFGAYVCDRLGAAVDFLVRDEDMGEVAEWIRSTLPFDRMYCYGANRPLHISYGPENRRTVVDMIADASGARMPRVRRSRNVQN